MVPLEVPPEVPDDASERWKQRYWQRYWNQPVHLSGTGWYRWRYRWWYRSSAQNPKTAVPAAVLPLQCKFLGAGGTTAYPSDSTALWQCCIKM